MPLSRCVSVFLEDIYVTLHNKEIFYMSFLPFDFFGVRTQVLYIPESKFNMRLNGGDTLYGEVELAIGGPDAVNRLQDVMSRLVLLQADGVEYFFAIWTMETYGICFDHCVYIATWRCALRLVSNCMLMSSFMLMSSP